MRKLIVPLFGLALVLALVAAVSPVLAHEVELAATLEGEGERPNPGDPDGTGASSVIINDETAQVCWGFSVSGITLPAAAAHIHKGEAGVAGDVVVPLSPPDAQGNASGCVTADAAIVSAILQNPAGYYVNVHTSDFPGGAIRGQLSMSSGGDGGGAPATMPETGIDQGLTTLLAGLALLALMGGLFLRSATRRETSA